MLGYFMIWRIVWKHNISCHVPSSSQLNKIISKYLIWRIGCKYVTNEFHEEKPKLTKSIWVNLFNCRINKFNKINSSVKNKLFENLSFQAGTLLTVHLALLRCKFQKNSLTNSINVKWKQKNTWQLKCLQQTNIKWLEIVQQELTAKCYFATPFW